MDGIEGLCPVVYIKPYIASALHADDRPQYVSSLEKDLRARGGLTPVRGGGSGAATPSQRRTLEGITLLHTPLVVCCACACA